MTDFVPATLAALRVPWHFTSGRVRRSAAAALPVELRTTGAVAALDAALAAYPELPEPVEAELPEEFTDYFDFTAEWLAERMPTLVEVSAATITAMLAERTAAPVSEVPEASVEALSRLWVRTITVEVIQESLALITDTPAGRSGDARIDSALSPAVRSALVEIVARELPRQSTYVGSILLSALAGLGGPADRLLDEIASAGGGAASSEAGVWSGLDPEVRRHARSVAVWRASMDAAEESPS